MFCYNCGQQIPDGSSFCPMCGRSLEVAAEPTPVQPTFEQPTVYMTESEQPTQPMYQQPVQQPVQPVYQQPVYQQPGQPMYQPVPQKKKMSTGMIVFIVLLCVIGIPIVIGCTVVGCVACNLIQYEETYSSGLEDFEYEFDPGDYDFDFNLDDYDFDDYDFGSSFDIEVDPAILEGSWIDYGYADEYFTISDNGDGTYEVDFTDYFVTDMQMYCGGEVQEATISECTSIDDYLFTGVLTMDFDDFEHSVNVIFNDRMIEFRIYDEEAEGNTYFCCFKDVDAENPDLEEDIIGEWSYLFETFVFNEGGTGEYTYDDETVYIEWNIEGDGLTVVFNPGEEVGESVMCFCAEVVDGKLTLYYISADDTEYYTDAEWVDETYRPGE